MAAAAEVAAMAGKRARAQGARVGALWAAATLLALACFVVAPLPADARSGAFTGLDSFEAEYVINPDGSVDVTEVLSAQFTGAPNRGIYRTLVVEQNYEPKPQTKRVYRIEDIRVSAPAGYSSQVSTKRDGPNLQIRIGDPDRTFGSGTVRYVLQYRIIGALNGFGTTDEFYWNVTGDEWNRIDRVSVRQRVPGNVSRALCFQGPTGSTRPCDESTVTADGAAEFRNGLLLYGGLTTVIEFPAGLVTPPPAPILESTRFNPASAFGITPLTTVLAAVLSVLFVGGVAVFVGVRGRDRQLRGSTVDQVFVAGTEGQPDERVPYFRGREIPVEFVPPDNLRPGLLGTLIDEDAGTVDVTATIVDLATRGYIRIVEAEPSGLLFKSPDWRLDHMNTDHTGLLPYETSLLDRLFKAGSTSVFLSGLKNTFAKDLDAIKTSLMDAAVNKGWFRNNPKASRLKLRALSSLLIAGILMGGLFLVGVGLPAILLLPFVLLSIALFVGAKYLPARTPTGTAVFRHALGFQRFITESEKYRAQFAERQNLFTEYLGYAVAFGATEKWAKTFDDLGLAPQDTSSWYWSSRPFSAVLLGESLSSFAVTSAGTLTSTPGGSGGSGFGGGGFSGGGGGGGGGGGW